MNDTAARGEINDPRWISGDGEKVAYSGVSVWLGRVMMHLDMGYEGTWEGGSEGLQYFRIWGAGRPSLQMTLN